MGTAYKNYLENVQNNLLSSRDNCWEFIKKSFVNNSIPDVMYNGANVVSTGAGISEGFAEYFESIYERDGNVQHTADNIDKNLGNELICILNVENDDILKAVKKLRNVNSVGPDEIPVYLVKGCIEYLVDPLRSIFSSSLRQSVFPNRWKLAKVCPIYKQGEKSQISNYRPVSLLSVFSKVFESVIYDKIYPGVESRIGVCQHGFLKGKSTVTNLCTFVDTVYQSMESGCQVDTVYTDFSKAFDKVNHRILLDKLVYAGFDPPLCLLMKSYLTAREQFVECKGFRSKKFAVNSGVPQGSNLGPLLFLIFINDISECVKHSECLLFADDFKLYKTLSSIDDCIKLQEDIAAVHEWSLRNRLKFNLNKCQVVTFSRKAVNIEYQYRMNDLVLSRKNQMKDLGVIFDEKLAFNNHINSLESRCYKLLGFICRITKEFYNAKAIKYIFDTLVRSKMEYASIIWSPYYTYQKLSLEKIQKKCLKYCYYRENKVKYEGDYDSLLRIFNTKSLERRRNDGLLLFLYKIIHGAINDVNLSSKLEFYMPFRELRKNRTFVVKYASTNYCKNSPIVKMCREFNNLSGDIDVLSASYGQFRRQVVEK